MQNQGNHISSGNRSLRKMTVRFIDLIVLSGLAFLVVIHLEYREPRPGATRSAYDRYMKEFVLEHNMSDLRKQAIDARLEFRNAEWEHTRRTRLTIGVAGVIFLYGFWRLLIYRG